MISLGTNETQILFANGRAVAVTSLAQAYIDDPTLNHPPLPIFCATAAYRLCGESIYAFGLLWKWPSIVADGASIAIVGSIGARRTASARAGRVAAILLALNPTSLLVVGYHGNADGTLAFFTLLAWWLADHGWPFLAGLRFDPLTIVAIYRAAFFVWNDGGVQCCMGAVPICAALRPRLTFLYGVGASIYLGWAYVAVLLPGRPFESHFDWFQDPVWHRAIGFPLAASLLLLISLLRRPRSVPLPI